MSKEKLKEYLKTLSKDRIVELCMQYKFDAEIAEQQLAEDGKVRSCGCLAKEKFIKELNEEYEIILGFQEYEKQIADLKANLAEKDKEIERLKFFEKAYYYNQLQASQEDIQKFQQLANQSAININYIAIQELEKVKVNLKDRISMMKNEEHSYFQKVVVWYDICDQINKQIKILENL